MIGDTYQINYDIKCGKYKLFCKQLNNLWSIFNQKHPKTTWKGKQINQEYNSTIIYIITSVTTTLKAPLFGGLQENRTLIFYQTDRHNYHYISKP